MRDSMPEHCFTIDLDNKNIYEMIGKDFIKTRKAILKSLGFRYLKHIRHYSIECSNCKLHFQVNIQQFKEGVKCPACKKLWKKGKQGRGLHLLIFAKGKKITPRRKLLIQYLLNDCEGRIFLSLLKLSEGAEIFELLFSKSRVLTHPSKRCQRCSLRQNIFKIMKKDKEEKI